MDRTEQQISSLLSAGESLLWCGQPRQGVAFRSSDWAVIPFSLMWCGFAIFWESSVVSMKDAPIFMKLWGVPFVLVGIYFVAGRFFHETWKRSKTYYGVTSERLLIVSGLTSQSVKSLSLKTLSDITITSGSNGEGSISFGAQHVQLPFVGMAGWPGAEQFLGPRFDLLPDVQSAYSAIQKAQRSVAGET